MSDNIRLGNKVEIIGKGLYGTVSYIGATQFASGKWIGVTLTQALGKNDGEVQGKRYFKCNPNCGVFVRPPQVSIMESPKLTRKSGDETQTPSSAKLLSARGDRERATSPSRQSRLMTPSSIQKPKSRLSYGPRPSSSVESSRSEPKAEPVVPKTVETVSKPEPAPQPEPTPQPEPPVSAAPSTTSYSSMSSFAPGVSMVEMESLKGQVKEWKEKFETIRLKRQEDRTKLKDFEKMRIQIQQLQDGKTRTSEQIQDLSKQLREAKKARDEAIEAKDQHVEEMADVNETIEMATLDKEMAEEKADMLQKEVETLNEKVEELQTDLEILKAEIEDSGTDGAATSYEVKQLTEQNTKLKEALVRMRDLSSAEKSEYQSLEKQLEKRTKELKEMSQKKEKLEQQLEKAESTVDELKEQVDAALAAEEMVEELTDKNLQQEEKIVDMEEQIHDLESINEMNDEFLENARDSELELREEIDLMRAKVLEAQRQTEASNEVVADYQDTIQKFRKVVQDLQESNQELRTTQNEQEEKSEADSVASQPPAFNYQIKMVESKATARSVDHDLRKLDVTQASLHTSLLQLFMPDRFSRRAGDSDCIQVVLLVKRFSAKAQIIGKHISDKFDLSSEVSKGVELLGVKGDQLTFASSLVSKLVGLQVFMELYDEALGKCSVELFQKIGTLYSEMLPYERTLDHLTDLLRKDTLDETTNTESIDKAVLFFKHLYRVHLSHEDFDCTRQMEQFLRQTQALFAAVNINTQRLKSFIQMGHETSDVAILLKDIATSCDDIKQFCKKIKRRIPQSATGISSTRLDFSDEVKDRLGKSLQNLISVHGLALDWVHACSKINRPSDSSSLPVTKMQELLGKAAAQAFEGKEMYGAARTSLGDVVSTMSALVTALQEGEYDTDGPPTKIHDPVEKRAQQVKSEMSDSEGLTSKLEEKDAAIVELRMLLKSKSDDVSESKIRIGMLERKVEKAGKEGNERASLLQQKLDSLTEDLKKKEKEYDETLDALQNDIDTLEAEKAELKQRLSHSKQSILSDLGMKAPGIGSPLPGSRSEIASILANTGAPSSAAVTDSPMLSQQIESLQTALRVERLQCSRLAGEKMLRDLKALTPLRLPRPARNRVGRESVKSQLNKLSNTLSDLAIPKVIDISKRRPGAYPVGSNTPYRSVVDEQLKLRVLGEQVKDLSIKTQQALAKGQSSEVKADLTTFPNPQFVKNLSPSIAKLVGSLQLNEKGAISKVHPGGASIPGQKLFLDLHQLQKLHEVALDRSIEIS